MTNVAVAAPIIADHTATDITTIPQHAIEAAKSKLHIAYGHTSHGRQLIGGMHGLVNFANNGGKGLSLPTDIFKWNAGGNNGALDLRSRPFSGAKDLGNPNRSAWAEATRRYLDANSEINVIVWSWCGQVKNASEADIDTYLDLMSELETDYPNVRFVYMTGHLEGQGLDSNVHLRNEQIRNYCLNNDKILFDFADIESYDPDGTTNYNELHANDNCDYDSDNDGKADRNWARDWMASHSEGVDWYRCKSAHSEALNGNQKAYAAWWLWARLAGWDDNESEEQPSEEQSSEEQPSEAQSSENQHSEEQSSENQPSEEQSSENQPSANLINVDTHYADSDNFDPRYPAEHLYDNNTRRDDGASNGTTGNKGIDEIWIEVDLGSDYNLTKASIFGDDDRNWTSTLWTLKYKSDPDDEWISAFSDQDCFGSKWFEQSLSVTGRYVRIEVTGNTDYHAVQVMELRLEGRLADQPETCRDGIHNGDETDNDCGGSCSPCGIDQQCQVNADCQNHSCDNSICQEKESPIEGQSLGNGDIAGLFYGNPNGGDHTGNANLFRHSASRRFMAQRTGAVTAVTYQNRVLDRATLDRRSRGRSGPWRACRNAGLDEYLCGYTTGNMYHVGNGGRIRIELRPDDGTENHFPADTVLAATETFVPMEEEQNHFIQKEFDRTVELIAGEIYHLVYMQLNPPRCNVSLSASRARSCQRDAGMVGLNGTYHDNDHIPNSPFGGQKEAILSRDAESEPWHRDADNLSWYALRYAKDGKWFGYMNASYKGSTPAGDDGGRRSVGGDNLVRQRIEEVQDKDYEVNGVWVFVSRSGSSSGDLIVAVKQDDSVLATGAISASEISSNNDWFYAELSNPVTLTKGQAYEVEFSSRGRNQFSIQSVFPLDYGSHKMADEADGGSWWTKAYAQYSSDGGSRWRDYSTLSIGTKKRDLGLVFTLVEGPQDMR